MSKEIDLLEIRDLLIMKTKEAYREKDRIKMFLLLDIGYKILKNLTIDKDLQKEILHIVEILKERIRINTMRDNE
jgi:hypothetical protein